MKHYIDNKKVSKTKFKRELKRHMSTKQARQRYNELKEHYNVYLVVDYTQFNIGGKAL